MNEFIIAIGMPIVRSVGGWANYALKDGKISKFELTKLYETILRTGILGTMIYFGGNSYGLDLDVVASSATAIILDLIVSNFKKA